MSSRMSNRDFRFYAGWVVAVIVLAIVGYEINAPSHPVDTSQVHAALAAEAGNS
jgi:hypothetical protein